MALREASRDKLHGYGYGTHFFTTEGYPEMRDAAHEPQMSIQKSRLHRFGSSITWYIYPSSVCTRGYLILMVRRQ